MATYYLNHGRLSKPNNVEWFNILYPVESQERIDSLKNLNLANPWIKTVIDSNTFEYQMYFTSITDFQTFISYSSAMPLSSAWHTYNSEYGIVETIIFRGYVEIDPITLQTLKSSSSP